MTVTVIRNALENAAQVTALRLLQKVMFDPRITEKDRRTFCDIWRDFEKGQEYRDLSNLSDTPETIFQNVMVATGRAAA